MLSRCSLSSTHKSSMARVGTCPKNSPQALVQCAGYDQDELVHLYMDSMEENSAEEKKTKRRSYKRDNKKILKSERAVRKLHFKM